VLRP